MNQRRAGRPAAALLATLTLLGGLLTVAAAPAVAAPVTVTDATFRWGVNPDSGRAEHFGGCRFLVAGTVGDVGEARVWDATDAAAHYRADDGLNSRVVKPNASGQDSTPTFATRCQDRNGGTSSTGSENAALIKNGTGTIDTAANTASIQWDGSFTVVHYGGFAGYWSAIDPQLTVNGDGTGTVTATVSGYASSRDNEDAWGAVGPTVVTLATLSGVTVTQNGLITTPDYLRRTVTASTPQVRTGTSWGAFPQPFVSFADSMGLGSFFYSSGGSDGTKIASRLLVGIGDTPLTGPVSTGTTLSVSPGGRVVVGKPVTLTATVTPASLGTVAFRDGSKPLGTVSVRNGRAQLTTKKLAPNPHSLRAEFVPADASAVDGSTAAPKLLTVVKAKSATTVKTKKKLRKGKKPVVRVRVKLRGTPLKARGKIRVKLGKAKRTVRLNTKGRAKVRMPKQKKLGKQKVTVTYRGNAKATSSKGTARIKVRKK